MTTIRRRTIPAAPAPGVRRTMRRIDGAASAAAKRQIEAEITADLQLIAGLEEEIASLTVAIDAARARIERQLREGKMAGYTDGKYEAKIEQPVGNSSRVYDNHKVYDKLGAEDFLQVVKVQAAEIKKFMSEKEIDKVSTYYPGEKKPEVLVVKRIEVKTKKVKPR